MANISRTWYVFGDLTDLYVSQHLVCDAYHNPINKPSNLSHGVMTLESATAQTYSPIVGSNDWDVDGDALSKTVNHENGDGQSEYCWILFRLAKTSGKIFSGNDFTGPWEGSSDHEGLKLSHFLCAEDQSYYYLAVGGRNSGRVEDYTWTFSLSVVDDPLHPPVIPSANGLRAGAPFTFSIDGTPFMPPAGAVLRFFSMDVDTLTVKGLPTGLVSRGSVVEAFYNGRRVFKGTPSRRVECWAKGNTHFENVTFEGPWGNLSRCVFRQGWTYKGENASHQAVDMTYSNAHVVLNRTSGGLPQNMTDQVNEIASFAASLCGYVYSNRYIDAGTQQLPADEAMDITCAAAIVRTLRFFPKIIAKFDYSGSGPILKVETPASTNASWISGAKVVSRSVTRKDHPIVGVEISTTSTNASVTIGGTSYDSRQFDTQSAGDTNSLDCLHIFLPLERGTSSTEYETLDCTGHVKTGWVVNNVKSQPYFWKQYHPRLKEVPQSAITISNVQVVDPLDPGTTVTPFRYITDLTVGDLRHYGQEAVACRFVCKAKIETSDDEEEDLLLTMDFVTTNATQRTYTQMVGMSSSEGETLPSGLAAAILAQRGGEVESEDIVIRLPDALPSIGDAKDGLYLQNMAIDCNDLTAELHFGHPNYLSAEEMRDLLSGFRSRAYSSSSVNRDEPDPSDGEAEETSGIQPISSTEFSPGTKKKTTIKASSGGGKIVLDSSQIGSGKTVAVHDLTFTPSGAQQPTTVKVIAEQDVTIPPGGGGGTTQDVITDISFAFDDTDNVLKASITKKKLTVSASTNVANPPKAALPLKKGTVVVGSEYRTTDHTFVNQTQPSVLQSDAPSQPTDATPAVFTAVEHTQGMDG